MTATSGHQPAGADGPVLAVDVGGTNSKGAVVESDGSVRYELAWPSQEPGRAPADLIRDLFSDLHAHAPDALGAALVVPGLVDETAGQVVFASNIELSGVPLRQLLHNDLGLPVVLGHDGRAAGVAEGIAGAAQGLRDYLVMPIGTGISIGIVSDGRSLAGPTFSAGEVGHMPVHPGGESCPCGQRGCLEAYASAGGLQRRYRALTGRTVNTPKILAAAAAGEAEAEQVWADAVTALGHALVTLTLTLDPSMIVLSGGLSQAGATLSKPVAAGLAAGLEWRPAPPVRCSTLGQQAARLGAAIWARQATGLPVPVGWGAAQR